MTNIEFKSLPNEQRSAILEQLDSEMHDVFVKEYTHPEYTSSGYLDPIHIPEIDLSMKTMGYVFHKEIEISYGYKMRIYKNIFKDK